MLCVFKDEPRFPMWKKRGMETPVPLRTFRGLYTWRLLPPGKRISNWLWKVIFRLWWRLWKKPGVDTQKQIMTLEGSINHWQQFQESRGKTPFPFKISFNILSKTTYKNLKPQPGSMRYLLGTRVHSLRCLPWVNCLLISTSFPDFKVTLNVKENMNPYHKHYHKSQCLQWKKNLLGISISNSY